MRKIIVIGGGPAGMMAAGTACLQGCEVTLLEKNAQPGRKLYITGKGRCNVTNEAETDVLLAHVNTNARFLYSAFNAFSSSDTIRFFNDLGVTLKTERGRRVFPVSDRASDIVKAMERFIRTGGVQSITGVAARAVETEGRQVSGVRTDRGYYAADAVIVATGGLSYPATGSTGDGFRFARALGHTVTPLFPSLTSLITAEDWVPPLAGLSLKNVRVTVMIDDPKNAAYEEQGELLFTHNGVSGPLILSASRYITDKLGKSGSQPLILIDLKPALSHEKLDERIQRDFQANLNKNFGNALDGLLPGQLVETIVMLSGIPAERKVNAITREDRLRLVGLFKQLVVTPVAVAGYEDAVITMGGVAVREINPSTLMSKKINGLYFAGEVLDVDAMTGGYNLQIAFSTGYLAGMSAASGN